MILLLVENFLILTVAGYADGDDLGLVVALQLDTYSEGDERIAVAVFLEVNGADDAPEDGYIAFDHDLVLFIGLLFIAFIAFSKF